MEISTHYFSGIIPTPKFSAQKMSFGKRLEKDTFEISFKGGDKIYDSRTQAISPTQKSSAAISAQIELKKKQYGQISQKLNLLTAKKNGASDIPISGQSFFELVAKANAIKQEIIDLETKYSQIRSTEIKSDSAIMSYDDFRAKIFGKFYKKTVAEKRIPDEMIERWAKNGHLKLERIGKNRPFYIDSNNEKNKETIKILQRKLPYASDSEQFKFKYNMKDDTINSFIKGDKISLLLDQKDEIKPSTYFLIDETSEITRNTLRERNKLVPFPSKFYKRPENNKEIWVPYNVLSKLGYGDKKTLFDGINRDKLCARKLIKETPAGIKSAICIDIADNKTECELKRLKETNKNLLSPRKLAEELNMNIAEIEEALLNEDISIIKRYIFEQDASKLLIDISDEKNSAFIDKTTAENGLFGALKLPQKKSKSASAVRMKVILHHCPGTMKTATDEAENNSDIKSIIAKYEENPYKKFNKKEKEAIKSYCKSVWDKAGTEEFAAAVNKADETMRIYREFGIDVIKDQEIKNILSEIR